MHLVQGDNVNGTKIFMKDNSRFPEKGLLTPYQHHYVIV